MILHEILLYIINDNAICDMSMNIDKNAQSDTMPYQALHDLNPPLGPLHTPKHEVSSTVINSARLIGSLTSFQNTGAMFMQGFPNGLQRGHPWACHGKIVKPHKW